MANRAASIKSQAEHKSQVAQLVASDTTPWWKKPNLRRLYYFLVPAAIDYDNPDGAILGLISSMYKIGTVVGILFAPYINDRFGRKTSIVLGSVITMIGIMIQTIGINRDMLIAARFVMGFGQPFTISGASQLIAELSFPKERAVISGLFHESWYAGAVLAAGVTLGTFDWTNSWAWRLPTLLQGAPALLQLSFIWFVPESPRFLIAKDRQEEALAILVKYHAEGDAQSPLIAAQFEQICTTIRLEQESAKYPIMDLFTKKANLRRVAIALCVGLFAQWSGNGLVSYYLTKVLKSIGITSRRTQNQINLGLMSWNLVTGIAGSFAQHYIRRRVQFLTSYTGMTIMFTCWTAASAVFAQDNTNAAASKAVVVLIFLYYALYNLMMPLAYLYITEIFPYIQRSKGMATMLFASRVGGFTNTFVNPIGLSNVGWKFYNVYVAWLAIETIIIYFLYPETSGVSLEEAAQTVEPGRSTTVDAESGVPEFIEYRGKSVDHVETHAIKTA